MQLGERIRVLREQRKLGVSEVARQIGVEASDIEQLEAGQRQLSHNELMALGEVLGVSVDEFFAQERKSTESSVLIPTARLNALLDQMKND